MTISIVVPVGPEEVHARWLGECMSSIRSQSYPSDDIIVVDDMHGRDIEKWAYPDARLYRPPWRLGCAGAWNAGVSMARNELVFLMGADDWLEPDCLATVKGVYNASGRRDGMYYVRVKYTDGREQDLPCNACAITKSLWRLTGGFSPEMGVGAPDSAFVSILWGRKVAPTVLCGQKVLYNVRVHPDQDTATRVQSYQGAIFDVRNILTANWRPTTWGRYE